MKKRSDYISRGETFYMHLQQLQIVAPKLRQAMDEAREAAETIWGGDLDGWSMYDICRYLDLAYLHHPLSPYRVAVELAKSYVVAIEQAQREIENERLRINL